ncbi:helix-turn-helix transcriptional regulator [Rothia nasimurium]|uniref:helix-turn-helix transcriptional regulator n=1 Tax=Rothia nasimurium TaxID=85336 RepID=UPI001F235E3C|nr:WYL domain-containing protein [Rothia nasimurium]
MTSKAVERAAALLDVLSSAPWGLDREAVRQRVPGYDQAATDAAFERMFERDKQVLRALGVELVAERADRSRLGFVYRLEARSQAVADFSALDVVVLSHCARAWEGTEVERLARAALLKVGASVGQRLGGELGEPARFTTVPGVAECLAAVAEGKGVSFRYAGRDEVRAVTCWGLGLRFGHWYLVGWDRARQGQRIFRLDRAAGLSVLAVEGPQPPASFSMARELADLEPEQVPLVASLPLVVEEDGRDEPQLSPSYGLVESALQAMKGGRTHRLPEGTSVPGVVGAYQQKVADEEERLRQELRAWHAPAPNIAAPTRTKAWKPVVAQRARESASDQLMRLLLMVSLIESTGGLSLATLADFFSTTEQKARTQLEGLASSVGFESLDLDINSAGFVTLRGQQVLTRGVSLTETEALMLSLALDLSASLDTESFYSHLRQKVWASVATENLPEVAPMPERVGVYRADLDPLVQRALDQQIPLDITYSSHRSVSRRVIEPLALIVDNGPRYLQAWCRLSGQVRHFRLDQILSMAPVEGDSFTQQVLTEPEAGEDASAPVSPRTWLTQLTSGKVAAETMILAVAKSLPVAQREKTHSTLYRYALETAEENGVTFYKIPVAHTAWALNLLIDLGPTVRLLTPAHLRQDLLELVGD